ncbi:MAG: VTT domain-containing protein [Candidatus Aenigmarchaeota archaeon]|nr:VTT domain-containing protein [Candidatus Aenigmarchaeota archaeon]
MEFGVVIVLIGVLAAIVYTGVDFRMLFSAALERIKEISPLAAQFIGSASAHIAAADATGVALFSFASRLFFVPLPLDPFLAYAYGNGLNPLVMVAASSFFGTLGYAVNYSAGRLLSKHVLKDMKAAKQAEKLRGSKFVSPSIFIASVLPVPDFTGLVFGALRVGIRKFLVYSFLGMVVKGAVIVYAFSYIEPYVKALV